MRFVPLVAQVSLASRTWGIIELPQTVSWRLRAMWRLEGVQLLKAQRAVTVGFDQRMLGGIARKPAPLLLVPARISVTPSRRRCNQFSGTHRVLLGQRSTGRLRFFCR